MDILINELSLEGQYSTVPEFLTEGLSAFINVLNEITLTNHILLKKYDFYKARITQDVILYDILRGDMSREYDKIRKFKSKLAKLFEEPFWEIDKRHSDDDIYLLDHVNINNSSIAESCERSKAVVSFLHSKFKICKISVLKNDDTIEIVNFFDRFHFLEFSRNRSEINFEEYVRQKFKGTNLDFSFIHEDYGFTLLDTPEKEKLFLSSFEKFSKMNWHDILKDDGFKYKPYQDQNVFQQKYKDKKIDKFRVSERCRCFGYRESDIFFTIRFELDHKLSDKG